MARRQSTSLKRRVEQLVVGGEAEEAYKFLVEKKWVPAGSGYQRHYPTGLELFVEVDETRQILKSRGRWPRYWAWELPGPYPLIPVEKINSAQDGMRAALMLMANLTLKDAAEQAAGTKIREPQLHEDGWNIAIDTPAGVVGLWSCWLGNQFYLGYPKTVQLILGTLDELAVRHLAIIEVPDKLIRDTLDMEPARPVKNIRFGSRQWAKFYGPQLPNNQGRVWVDHSDRDSSGHHFEVISPSGGLQEIYYGHDYSRGVRTYEFSFFDGEEPEAPNASQDAIRPYRDKFLALACAVAEKMGGASAVTINYGFCMVPEDLEREGYEIEWLKGVPGRREGWGADIVRAVKGGETIILKSGNSLVPWSTIRRVPFDGSVEALKGLLTF